MAHADLATRKKHRFSFVAMSLCVLVLLASVAAYAWIELHAPAQPNTLTNEISRAEDHGYVFYIRPYQSALFEGRLFFALWFILLCLGVVNALEKERSGQSPSFARITGLIAGLVGGIIIGGFIFWRAFVQSLLDR